VARCVAPSGTLDALDLQSPMLDAVSRRAAEGGVDNIVTAVGDACQLPWDDATFDGAYLVTVLGEIPGRQQALSELHRTIKRGGRLVAGEMMMDPDNVSLATLRHEAESVGFAFDRVFGPRAWYIARFTHP
jgi:ubiquinone/menaquinone biosynthesis C-methylase UbiE